MARQAPAEMNGLRCTGAMMAGAAGLVRARAVGPALAAELELELERAREILPAREQGPAPLRRARLRLARLRRARTFIEVCPETQHR